MLLISIQQRTTSCLLFIRIRKCVRRNYIPVVFQLFSKNITCKFFCYTKLQYKYFIVNSSEVLLMKVLFAVVLFSFLEIASNEGNYLIFCNTFEIKSNILPSQERAFLTQFLTKQSFYLILIFNLLEKTAFHCVFEINIRLLVSLW